MCEEEYPTQEQIDDFATWVDDLSPEQENRLKNDFIEIVNSLPKFTKDWTIDQLWSVIQDQL